LDAKGSLGNGEHVQITNWRCRYNPVSHALEEVKSNPGQIEVSRKPVKTPAKTLP